MNVSCPECRSVFRVDPAKVPDGGIRARCSVCGGIIRIAASAPNADFADVPPSIARATPIRRMTPVSASPILVGARGGDPPASSSAPASTDEDDARGSEAAASEAAASEAGASASVDPEPSHDGVRQSAEPEPGAESGEPAAAPTETAVEAGSRTEDAPASRDADASGEAGPAADDVVADDPAPERSASGTVEQQPEVAEPVRAVAPAPFIPRASDDRPSSSASGGWGRSAPAWPSSPDRAQAVPSAAAAASSLPDSTPPAVTPLPRTTASSVPRVAPRQPTPPGGSATPGPARRPLNPFLANDRNVKAKRLARALVSDMVAYNPSEREAGLRDGSLKQRFREEIKKSYEEYVEQMGKEFAETTTHFQDALNDILAGGQRVF